MRTWANLFANTKKSNGKARPIGRGGAKKKKVAARPPRKKGKIMNENETKVVTRAEKKDAVKALVRELLAVSTRKRTELIDEAAKAYVERYPGEDTENVNDVKGRIGSVLDVMKKDGEIEIKNGVCALKEKAEEKPKKKTAKKAVQETATEEKPVEKKAKKTTKKVEKEATEVKDETVKDDKPKAKRTTKKSPLPPPPIAPIAPIAPDKPDEPRTIEPTPLPETEKTVEPPKAKRAVKSKSVKEATEAKTEVLEAKETVKAEKTKRTAKKKSVQAEEKTVETVEPEKAAPVVPVEPAADSSVAPMKAEEKTEEKSEEKKPEVAAKETTPAVAVKEEQKAEKKDEKKQEKTAKPAPVYDLTAIFGEKKTEQKPREEVKVEPIKTEVKADKKPEVLEKKEPTVAEKVTEKPTGKVTEKPIEKPVEKKETADVKPQEPAKKPQASEGKPQPQKTPTAQPKERKPINVKAQQPKAQPLTADEKLKEEYLDKIHSLGGDYFEYYCVYLLERHARMYGRRLEGLKITGGDHDGGIDGELELTDGLGFRETVYIQAKNWDPERGNKKLWTVGETCLQQFLGACAYRQAVEGKQQTRGIFITSSRFTPEAKKMLNAMSDKLVGYDCDDLYETAKECSFGLIQKNGEWTLDLNLLSGEKAFFRMF